MFSSSPINHIATCKTIGMRQVHKQIGNDAASLLYLSIYHVLLVQELKYQVYSWFYILKIHVP